MVRNEIDNLILGFDRALRSLTGQYQGQRPNPAGEKEETVLDDLQLQHTIGLMRVNHCGEICAQALYEGQAVTAKSTQTQKVLQGAADEERDHLAWCGQRLEELGGRPSLLNPLFYGVSFLVGAVTGLVGDKVSLGFVEATEDQVVDHLERHLDELPKEDERSRAILEQMRADEQAHGMRALDMGGEAFPQSIKRVMTVLSRVMTQTTYKI